ncbi:transmembrane protein 192 isoform X2 [Carcharodon carcharias]|uniref:transmembrane protein 192 isoform X2 n=1 Tax=Carcharodon carcharias TaxID=13397 RepID=UPI001B7E7F4E|nr:transmembrane protein 192 isoform X2 [Carcharodon carcharias]
MNSEARQRQENSSIDVTQSVEEDPLIDYPLLYADALVGDVRAPFKGVPTVCWAILLTFLHVAFVVLAFLSVFFCAPPADLCRDILGSFSLLTIITITKVVLWALHAVFEYYLQAQHSKARHRGYLTLYRSTRHLKRLPLLIHSAAKIIKFNQMEPCPDIQEEERRQRCPNLINVLSETGFRDGSNLENLVEKQADLIDYLKMHNVNLSKRLLALISQQVRD